MLESADSARGWTLAQGEIDQLDIRTSRRTHAFLGAKIGMLIGAVPGLLIGLATCQEGFSKATCVGEALTAPGLIGLVVGGVSGALTHTDTWYSGASVRPMVRPLSQGVELGMAIRF